MARQIDLLTGEFRSAQPANPLYCHQDFLDKLAAQQTSPLGKRASLLLQRLAIDERRIYFKATRGENRGWRRSRLGGNQGSHFYAWWAPKMATPLRDAPGMSELPDGAIVLRDIRHHDDHSPCLAQDLGEHYLPFGVPDLRSAEYAPPPWTGPQAKFASARQTVRILKGYPGSGKTTALLHAADSIPAQRILYLTFSRDLANLARQYFDRYCSRDKHFHVAVFPNLVRELVRQPEATATPDRDLRAKFRMDLSPYQRSLGAWSDQYPALFDEFHAHLVGAALPFAAGRFNAAKQARVGDANFRAARGRYLGNQAIQTALDAAGRLERNGALADRYFPELGLAWRALSSLAEGGRDVPPELLDFDCIAVDECQDLTPMEASVVIELAAQIGKRRKSPVPLLMAGDEAQTVRPTDFEFRWLNDLLHHRLGTPTEFRLSANLRSPRQIAMLVNRVWDLYDEIDKKDRPSGSGLAEIDDDSTDQVLYCVASPGAELNELLATLAAREGLALMSLDDQLPGWVPSELRDQVLTAREVKGLDFDTVCVLDAGRQLERIGRFEQHRRSGTGEIEGLRKRLAIDQLRVALSRPTGRLIWIDINPTSLISQAASTFMNDHQVSPSVLPAMPSAIQKGLEEEELDVEERIQRAMADARQYLEVRPGLAWSRANQAVGLLGPLTQTGAVQDVSLRNQVYSGLIEIAVTLALRGARLPPEFGMVDLWDVGTKACSDARIHLLPALLRTMREALNVTGPGRVAAVAMFADRVRLYPEMLTAWMRTELAGQLTKWTEEMEAAALRPEFANDMIAVLPGFYDALHLPDAEARKVGLRQRTVGALLKAKRHAEALAVLMQLPERDPALEAECHSELGRFAEAAELYRQVGNAKAALDCYRRVPDFENAAALIREVGEHSAGESYEWLLRFRQLVAERPANFNRVMIEPEKKVLEQMLEEALGVARKKPGAKKAAKKTVSKSAVKKAAAPRSNRFF